MSDTPEPAAAQTTTATSKALFGWTSPGRDIALIVVGSLFGILFGAAVLSGAVGVPGPDPATAAVGRTGLVREP